MIFMALLPVETVREGTMRSSLANVWSDAGWPIARLRK
jgi:hypothetical protein